MVFTLLLSLYELANGYDTVYTWSLGRVTRKYKTKQTFDFMKIPLILLGCLFISTRCLAQEDVSMRELGLVAYLAEVKTLSETKMEMMMNDANYIANKDKTKRINSAYTALRLHVDQLVLQLITDSKRKNNLKLYRNIDDHFKKSEAIKSKAYDKVLKAIAVRYEQVMMFTYSSTLSGPSFEELTGAAGIVWGIIERARDFREKKVAGIAEQLDKLRLKSISELKNKDDEKEPKKD